MSDLNHTLAESEKPLFDKFSEKENNGNSNTKNSNKYTNNFTSVGNGTSKNNGSSSHRRRDPDNEETQPTKRQNGEWVDNPDESVWSRGENMAGIQAQISALQTRLYVLAAVAIGGLVVLLILGSVFLPMLFHKLAHHSHKPGLGAQVAALIKDGLCMPCQDFRFGPDPEEDSKLDPYRDEREGSIQCCVDTPLELMDILKMYIQRQFELELAKGTVALPQPKVDGTYPAAAVTKPAAHLMMTRQPTDRNIQPGDLVEIRNWRFHGDKAFVTGGITYDEGSIVIPADGYYFVYSQISFFIATNDLRYREPSLSIYLFRRNPLYHEGQLAQNSITKCATPDHRYEEYSLTIGAVYWLRRQDHLFIKVSNLTTIVTKPYESFFGTFRI